MMPYKKLCFSGLILFLLTPTMVAYAAGAGLPQLDISTWPSQLFWLVVLFGTGYLLMSKIVTPRIGKVLEERRTKLDGYLSKARSASEDAATTRTKYEQDLEAARTTAAETAKKATTEALIEAEVTNAKVAKRLSEKVSKAEAKIANARNEAIDNLNAVAAEAAMEAVLKLTEIKTTPAQASKIANKIAVNMSKKEAH
jgi:F-type H+-transporting ATPase subunit b